MDTFGGIRSDFAEYETAEILLQAVLYDGTSTWGKGADKGFDSFMEAARNMELYDIETDSEVYKEGIHILPPLKGYADPAEMYSAVYKKSLELIDTGKFTTFIGGEHSISIGIIEAFRERFDDLTVLQLDAHADLRPEYARTPYNHACAMYQASLNTNLIQVGIRSMDSWEKEYLKPDKCVFADEIASGSNWMDRSLDLMTQNVYISLDLDVFDPSIMPSTGTPEPGGLDWYTVINYLRRVFRNKNVLGFDIVEFAPMPGLRHPDFLVAKLYYKLLSYKFNYGR